MGDIIEKNKYDNHVFSKEDIERAIIKKWQYPLLFFLPTYVQLNEGFEFHYKFFQGQYYLMKTKPFNQQFHKD